MQSIVYFNTLTYNYGFKTRKVNEDNSYHPNDNKSIFNQKRYFIKECTHKLDQLKNPKPIHK